MVRLAGEIAGAKARGETDDGRRYYEYWLAALEGLVLAKNLAAGPDLAARRHAWEDAYRNTPHGRPVDFGRSGGDLEHESGHGAAPSGLNPQEIPTIRQTPGTGRGQGRPARPTGACGPSGGDWR